MNHEWVTAIGTAIAALAAVASALISAILTGIAYFQLRDIRKQIELAAKQNKSSADQERRRNTLIAIQRFENDPLLKQAMKNLWVATDNGKDYTQLDEEHRFDVITILNYFEGIACGILQEVYIEEMARDYLHGPVGKAVKAFIIGESGDGWKSDKGVFPPAHFESLMKVYATWFPGKSPGYRAKDH
jgi:hypothetical protein